MAVILTKSFADILAPVFSSLYVGLIKQNGEECFGGSYARQQIGSVDICDDADYIYIQNINPIVFPLATEVLALVNNPVSKLGLFSNATTTNASAIIDLPFSKPYLVQDQFKIPSYGLTIKIPKTYT
jgi:hypothetical protein